MGSPITAAQLVTYFVNIADRPSPPQSLRVTEVYKDFVVVEWDVPETDGGSPLISYTVEKRDMKRAAFVKVEETKPNVLTLKIPKLVEGNQYMVRVCAENDVGTSDWAELPEPVTAKLPFGMYHIILS